MRSLLERSLPLIIASLLVWWALAPPAQLEDSPVRWLVLVALGLVMLVVIALWALARVSVAGEVHFELLEDEAAEQGLRDRAAALLSRGFEAGPPRLVSPRPGTPMMALPLVYRDGTSWALVIEIVGREEALLEIMTVFEGGLRFSTIDNRTAAASPRPACALMQIKQRADAAALWEAHERTLRKLEGAGLKPKPAVPGDLETLLRSTTKESLDVIRARPFSAPAITVWRLLFAANPCERALLSQPAAVRELRRRGVEVALER